ncbi:flagellar motor protein MotB [Candidatus Liberibacter americanus]|uniref:Flagellar motor protein n=1 Tax=Candidatus Liberibacter americanus str. Sao Paulo TaxID=1261131 RepID=U6B580_9HYPH|nr:flagellar motor protein MotB [Candidatus Liberibacter americanus]AHA27753.1 Flagellar motor protein [Candidatus Liberibacter americanus str. Sao Paulo]EMS36138.1 flagellar motor protein MotB [Candidatus Liberibacter americanus PW_SP]
MNHHEGDKNHVTKYIIIRKKKSSDYPKNFHTWKIAYADFMTALMSFFLLMWITHSIDDKTKISIESYFNPFKTATLSTYPQGLHDNIKVFNHPPDDQFNRIIREDLPFHNHSDYSIKNHISKKNSITKSYKKTNKLEISSDQIINDAHQDNKLHHTYNKYDLLAGFNYSGEIRDEIAEITEGALQLPKNKEALLRYKIKKRAQDLEKQIKLKLKGLTTGDLLARIAFQYTKQGVIITIADQVNYPMFEKGSSIPLSSTIILIKKIGEIISQGNEKISIQGHTDAYKYSNSIKDNWKLSFDRAYTAYKILREVGISENRILKISGFADHHLKILSDPMNESNRRIEILLQEE